MIIEDMTSLILNRSICCSGICMIKFKKSYFLSFTYKYLHMEIWLVNGLKGEFPIVNIIFELSIENSFE